MGFYKRLRLIFWLVNAYIARWGKIILLSFVSGLLIFFLLLGVSRYMVRFISVEKHPIYGLVGDYTLDVLPPLITQKISKGLTVVSDDDTVKPGMAKSWDITDNGKKYTFHLQPDQTFSNGKHITATSIDYNFADVKIERPDEKTITYTLSDSYAPFLVTVSRPVFYKGLAGAGDWKVQKIDIKSTYVKSLRLVSRTDPSKFEDYEFYPTQDALKIAFAMGEINHAIGLDDLSIKNTSFSAFNNVTIQKKPDYTQLVTLFFNTQDRVLSDKKVRSGLAYALPDTFDEGERAVVSYAPTSIYYNNTVTPRKQDTAEAKLLTQDAFNSSGSATLTIKTLPQYEAVAQKVAKAWNALGAKTKIEEVMSVPPSFQIYLGDFMLPKDPDQYTIWHSNQENNITKYKNLRIDKLLEDGRKVTNINERKKIYADFQKYLQEDEPAVFLYFPYQYDLLRK